MRGQYKRETSETKIEIVLDTDATEYENFNVETGIGFFDHMLLTFSRYANFKGYIKVVGDINVDCHHTIEDTGIAIGKTIKAMINEKSITRFSNVHIPMDEALVRGVIDLGGRAYIDFDYEFKRERLGTYDTDMTLEFLRAVAMNSEATIHIDVLKGKNDHHITEAIYKALGLIIKEAIRPLDSNEIFSTKGRVNENENRDIRL